MCYTVRVTSLPSPLFETHLSHPCKPRTEVNMWDICQNQDFHTLENSWIRTDKQNRLTNCDWHTGRKKNYFAKNTLTQTKRGLLPFTSQENQSSLSDKLPYPYYHKVLSLYIFKYFLSAYTPWPTSSSAIFTLTIKTALSQLYFVYRPSVSA